MLYGDVCERFYFDPEVAPGTDEDEAAPGDDVDIDIDPFDADRFPWTDPFIATLEVLPSDFLTEEEVVSPMMGSPIARIDCDRADELLTLLRKHGAEVVRDDRLSALTTEAWWVPAEEPGCS